MNITQQSYADKAYKVCNGTYYHSTTADEVIRLLETIRSKGQRIKLHYGYTTEEDAKKSPTGSIVGQDWQEENDVTGTIGRSTGIVKIPLMIRNSRSTGGPGILDDCIVKITTASKKKPVTLYQHPKYFVSEARNT